MPLQLDRDRQAGYLILLRPSQELLFFAFVRNTKPVARNCRLLLICCLFQRFVVDLLVVWLLRSIPPAPRLFFLLLFSLSKLVVSIAVALLHPCPRPLRNCCVLKNTRAAPSRWLLLFRARSFQKQKRYVHEDGEMRPKIGGCSRPLRLDAGDAQDVPYRSIWRGRSGVARVGMPLTRGGDRRVEPFILIRVSFRVVLLCVVLCRCPSN